MTGKCDIVDFMMRTWLEASTVFVRVYLLGVVEDWF